MKFSSALTFCLSFAFLVACHNQSGPPVSNDIATERLVYQAYQPALFVKDQRAEKIMSVAPEIHRLMEAHAKSMHLPGVAYGIVVDNQLIVSSAIGSIDLDSNIPASTQSAFRIASMTKSFTAMAILKLRDEGKLSLDDPVEEYIPEMKKLEYLTSDSPLIDIENLLTMTAGFPEDNPWGDRQLDEPDSMLLELAKSGISLSNPPSFVYEYSNTGFALLGNIISRVSGQPYQQYITENILQPLKMENTYWEYDDVPEDNLVSGYRWEDNQWKLEPMLHDGSYGAMGGLITTIEDFSKYVSFHLSAWPPRSDVDNGPIKRSSLREMHTPQFPRLYPHAKAWSDDSCPVISGYGFGLGISEDCHGIRKVRHGGALPGFGSTYEFYPEYGVGIMAFCNLTYTPAMPTTEIVELLFDKLDLQPRVLQASEILLKRQKQVAELIQNWDPALEKEILAENFYLDKSREHRMAEIQEVLQQVGELKNMGEMKPLNQLRGSFIWQAKNGEIEVFFTLSPEHDPRVQYLSVSLANE